MKKSPLSQVQQRFQSKEKLVEEVQKLATDDLWLDRVNGTKGLARVSNTKLLRLHGLLTDAKERFGSRGKLIDGILDLTKRVRDAGYRTRLEAHPLPRLLDLHGTLSKKQSRSQAKQDAPAKRAKAKAAQAAAPAKKAPAKKAPAKKAPAKKAARKKG
jgi:hypothetical protein